MNRRSFLKKIVATVGALSVGLPFVGRSKEWESVVDGPFNIDIKADEVLNVGSVEFNPWKEPTAYEILQDVKYMKKVIIEDGQIHRPNIVYFGPPSQGKTKFI